MTHYLINSSWFRVLAAEQRQVAAADERKREFHEEKRNEFESHAEEENDGGPTEFSRVPSDRPLTKILLFQNKTRGPERAPSSGESSTTMGCILPKSTTDTTPETQVETSGTLLQFFLR